MAEVYSDRTANRPFRQSAQRVYDRTVRPATTTRHALSSTARVGIGLLLIALAIVFLLIVIF